MLRRCVWAFVVLDRGSKGEFLRSATCKRRIDGSKSSLEVADLTRLHLGLTLANPILPHLVTPVLFLGPLYAMYLGQGLPFQKFWYLEAQKAKFLSLTGLRTYIAVSTKPPPRCSEWLKRALGASHGRSGLPRLRIGRIPSLQVQRHPHGLSLSVDLWPR